MKVLILDNYDSFTYNLVHMVKELGYTPEVFRNDKISLDDVDQYDKILLSPGPGIPEEAGIMPELIKRYAPTKSIFGVCLGHQAIGEAFGASLFNMAEVHHGLVFDTSVLNHDKLFKGVPSNFQSCRYHSWAIQNDGLPEDIMVTATDDQGVIMAIAHSQYDVQGVQFHPESFLTEHGETMLKNWLNN